MWRWVKTGWPRPVAWLDWTDAEVALREWASPPYDLVWFYACGTWLALGDVVEGHTVVDLNDLEDLKLVTLMKVADLDKREGVVRRSFLQRLRRALGAMCPELSSATLWV